VESRAAGACKFSPEGGCEIRLSEPVLKLRTTADLKKTLLHEMIHAYIFSTTGNKDHEQELLSHVSLLKLAMSGIFQQDPNVAPASFTCCTLLCIFCMSHFILGSFGD
jgi:predicted SprT family Zn-dependent metalloprotease